MRIILTSAEIARFRSLLYSYPEALEALDAIEDCEGDVEDAAIGLAIQAGQEPNTSERWLEGLTKRCRPIICRRDLKKELLQENLSPVAAALKEANICPPLLIAPVLIFVFKTGVDGFCESYEYKLSLDETLN
ncbi:MAG: hypothetical protein F6J93_25390 [Oscillatoria sp. SIO1A7]|nr:hypothetical protein [Oscillatoria sp. SIO1A7]